MDKNSTFGIKLAMVLAAIIVVLLLTSYIQQNNTSPNRTVQIAYTFTVGSIPPRADKMQIWVPVPPSNNQQTLHDFNISGNRPCRMIEEHEFGNKFLFFDINNLSLTNSCEVDFSIKFRVTRYAVRPLSEHPMVQANSQNEPARYLASNRLIPIDGKVADEARQIAGYNNDPLKQARLLYNNIVSTVRYDKSGTGWGRGDAVYACDVRRGNCTDFHSLFIGQARALGIPARFIMGLPLPEGKTEGKIAGYHCWGEFYLKEKGWCPIDASEANKFPEKKEQFFGGLDENRVAFTLGRDIKLPGSHTEPLNYVIYPYVEIDGQSHENVRTSFSFKDCSP